MHGHQLIIESENIITNLAKVTKEELSLIEIGSERGSGSTLSLAKFAQSLGLKFITVDADEEVVVSAREIIKSIDQRFEAHHQLGEVFLSNYPFNNIAVVYMDAFDIVTDWPHKQETIDSYKRRDVPLTNEMAWKMHLEASKAVHEKIIPGGLICFDDVWKDVNGQWQGKGKTAIPFLLEHGYKLVKFKPDSLLLENTIGLPLRKAFIRGIKRKIKTWS